MDRSVSLFRIALLAVLLASVAFSRCYAFEKVSKCDVRDETCKQFEKLTEDQQPEKIVERFEADRNEKYSDASRAYAGNAYLALASAENIDPAKEESLYRKALGIDHYIAYMGLYFLYAQKDEEKALGFLREYVAKKPADTVPYVILGEAELTRGHFDLADAYLRQGKAVAHAHSPRVDWLLFQANYQLKNYAVAADMFGTATTTGSFATEVKALKADPKFAGIEKRPEFAKYKTAFNQQ